MNLYLISQDENKDHDTFDSAVVKAGSEDEARNMHPGSGLPIDWDSSYSSYLGDWCSSPEKVSVEHIGISEDADAGVVCSSFR